MQTVNITLDIYNIIIDIIILIGIFTSRISENSIPSRYSNPPP